MSCKFVHLIRLGVKIPNHNEWFRQHYHQFSAGAAVKISQFNQNPLSTSSELSPFLHSDTAEISSKNEIK